MGLGVGGKVDAVDESESGMEYCNTRDGVDTGDAGYLLGDVAEREAIEELAPNGVLFVLAENARWGWGVDLGVRFLKGRLALGCGDLKGICLLADSGGGVGVLRGNLIA